MFWIYPFFCHFCWFWFRRLSWRHHGDLPNSWRLFCFALIENRTLDLSVPAEMLKGSTTRAKGFFDTRFVVCVSVYCVDLPVFWRPLRRLGVRGRAVGIGRDLANLLRIQRGFPPFSGVPSRLAVIKIIQVPLLWLCVASDVPVLCFPCVKQRCYRWPSGWRQLWFSGFV
jgi:hypothetical protein